MYYINGDGDLHLQIRFSGTIELFLMALSFYVIDVFICSH
jgi:hypothetical protein